MKILKFGGTSVGSVESIINVRNIVASIEGRKIIVCSAMSGVTNELVNIAEYFKNGNISVIQEIIDQLEAKHINLSESLINDDILVEVKTSIFTLFKELANLVQGEFNSHVEAQILTFGETVLTYIVSNYLRSQGMANGLLNAKEFMHVGNLENPDTDKVGRLIYPLIDNNLDLFITQGFVRIDKYNRINTLKRGGSDYTATILGAAVIAEEIQIWTDISGFHNNDPRYVENTHSLSHLTFEEAAELAYFGAKILHPQTVSPVIDKNIPIYLKNTFTPEAAGTKISSDINSRGLKAISAKDGITAIKIKSNRMLMAHGFLKKIFEVFDHHQTAIDMITTSEIAISLTIDDDTNLDAILKDITAYGEITVESNHSIICVVGEGLIEDSNTSNLFNILKNIPVRMISYGGSVNNVSLLVATDNKIAALQSLHHNLFKPPVLA